MANYEEIAQAVIAGDAGTVKELTQKAISAQADPNTVISDGLIAGMDVVGRRFKYGEMFVPEVLMAAKAMHAGMDLLKPLLTGIAQSAQGKVVLGTVKGDLHDIGKNLVGMLLEAGGFEVVNLGIDIAPETFVDRAVEEGAQVIAMSALLTTTMLIMKDTIELLEEEDLRGRFKVIVGGAPVSQDFADEIGADGFAPDAASAVDLCRKLLAV